MNTLSQNPISLLGDKSMFMIETVNPVSYNDREKLLILTGGK